jgi:hypothetical protein
LKGHVKEEMKMAYQTFVETRRGRDAVLIDLEEAGCEDIDWNELALDRAQWKGSYECNIESSGFRKGREIFPAEQLSASPESLYY